MLKQNDTSVLDFIEESESNNSGGSYQNVSVQWLKFSKNETKELVILSRVNRVIDGKQVVEFNPDSDMLAYSSISPFLPNGLKDTEGNTWYVNLPVLDESLHSENQNNPYFQIEEVLGLQEYRKPKFLMWVMDANANVMRTVEFENEEGKTETREEPNIFLWSPAKTIVKALAQIEIKNSKLGILGRVIEVKRTDPKGKGAVEYSLQPNIQSFTGDPVVFFHDDNTFTIDVEQNGEMVARNCSFPNKLIDNVGFTSVDSQVSFCNRIRQSLMDWLESEGKPLSEWVFTVDDENFNGTIKPQFLPNGAGGFEV